MHFSFGLFTCFHKSAAFLAGPRWPARHLIPCSFVVVKWQRAVLMGITSSFSVGCHSQVAQMGGPWEQCVFGYSQGFCVRGAEPRKAHCQKDTVFGSPCSHSVQLPSILVWPSGYWSAVLHITVPFHEVICSQTLCSWRGMPLRKACFHRWYCPLNYLLPPACGLST